MFKETINAWKNFILGTYELFFVPHQKWKSKPETFRSFALILGSAIIACCLIVAAAWTLVFLLLNQ